MKVVIGPYKSWIGPYQIADAVFFWQDKYNDDCVWANRAHRFGHWLGENKDGSDSLLLRFCNWLQTKRKRQVFVRIDDHDTWGMDTTLANIVLPMLKQLQATKHGSPFVDDADVPEHLKSTSASPKMDEYDIDNNHHLRWDYALNEMIWVFEQKITGDGDSQFYEHSEPIRGESLMDTVSRMKIDHEGLAAYQARRANGFKLFGKYYEALWD